MPGCVRFSILAPIGRPVSPPEIRQNLIRLIPVRLAFPPPPDTQPSPAMKISGVIALTMLVLMQFAIAAVPHGFLHAAVNALHRAEQTMDPKDLLGAKKSLEASIEVVKESDRPATAGLPQRRMAHEQVVLALKALESKDRVTAAACIKKAIKAAEVAMRAP